MAFTTMIARYPGKCARCGRAFEAGTTIRYAGRQRTYHLVRDCPMEAANAATVSDALVLARDDVDAARFVFDDEQVTQVN